MGIFRVGGVGMRLILLFVNLYELVAFLSSSSVPLVLVVAMLVILLQFIEIRVVTFPGMDCCELQVCKGDAILFNCGLQVAS